MSAQDEHRCEWCTGLMGADEDTCQHEDCGRGIRAAKASARDELPPPCGHAWESEFGTPTMCPPCLRAELRAAAERCAELEADFERASATFDELSSGYLERADKAEAALASMTAEYAADASASGEKLVKMEAQRDEARAEAASRRSQQWGQNPGDPRTCDPLPWEVE